MKYPVAAFLLAVVLLPSAASAEGIGFFKGHFPQALEEARRTGKLLFVDVYTQWCGPCKMMDREVFPLPEVGAYYNTQFINLKLDAESEAENGPALKVRYGVEVYPTYLFIDADGKLLSKASSRMSAPIFLAVGRQAIDSGEERFAAIAGAGRADDASDEAVRAYLFAAQVQLSMMSGEGKETLRKEMAAVRDRYFAARKPDRKLTVEDVALIQSFYFTRGDNPIDLLIADYATYAALQPAGRLAAYLIDANDDAIRLGASYGRAEYKHYIDDIRGPLALAYRDHPGRLGLEHTWREQQLAGEFYSAVGRQDWSAACAAEEKRLTLLGDRATWEDWYRLPREFAHRAPDGAALGGAVRLADKAFVLSPSFLTASTLGRLLARTEDRDRAREVLDRALAFGEKEALKNKQAQLRALAEIRDAL